MVGFVGKTGIVQCVHVCLKRLFRRIREVLEGDLEGRKWDVEREE